MTLGGQRPIAYNVNLARAAGDVKAGLFLSQLLYWTRVGIEVDARQGWIFKTREQWTLETGLSRAEQERCRSLLLTAGLIQESRFAGSPARLGFRIQPEALGMAISSMLRRDPVQWTLFDLRSSEQHVRALLGRNMAFYRVYVDALGSVPLAVFVTKALEIQRRLLEAQIDKERRRKAPTHPEEWQQNWFSLSVEQWEIETALRAGQVRKCKQELCLSGVLEEATQTWPRKRQFVRVDLAALSQVLINVLSEQRAAVSSPAAGLLQTLIGRSVKRNLRIDQIGATVCRSDSQGISATICRTGESNNAADTESERSEEISDRFPGKQSAVFSDMGDGGQTAQSATSPHAGRNLRIDQTGATVCRSASPGSSTTVCRTDRALIERSDQTGSEKISDCFPGKQSAVFSDMVNGGQTASSATSPHVGRNLRIALPSTGENSRQLARVSKSVNPAGEISQTHQALSAVPEGTLNVTHGEFEHDLRRVSAPLHARASLGLQDFTTTTTTSAPNARRSLQVGDISTGRRVVVVSSSPSQGIPSGLSGPPGHPEHLTVAPLAWPAGLSSADVELAKRLLAPAPISRRQALLDELAGRQRGGTVRNPVGYLRQLVSLDRDADWDMVLELAHDEAERRSVRAKRMAMESVVPSTNPARAGASQRGDAAALPSGVPSDVRQKLIALRASIVSKSPTLRQGESAHSKVAVPPSQVSDADKNESGHEVHCPSLPYGDKHHQGEQQRPSPGRLESSPKAAEVSLTDHRR